MKLCEYYQECPYEASIDFFSNVCAKCPEVCLLYKWKKEGQELDDLFFDDDNKLEKEVE